MPKYSDFDLAYQSVVSVRMLFLHQTEFTQLLKVVIGHAWTTEV